MQAKGEILSSKRTAEDRIAVTVDKKDVPGGTVLLDDVANLTKGLSESITRLIHKNLGHPGRVRPSEESKRLSKIVLANVAEGSGILEFNVLPSQEITGRSPSIIAASQLVRGVQYFEKHAEWPRYLPASIRSSLAGAVSPVLTDHARVELSVIEHDHKVESCRIDHELREALLQPETFSVSEPVQIIGEIYDINIETKHFKINAKPKKITITIDDDDMLECVDRFRWKRVFVAGFPEDARCKKVSRVKELRLADDKEQDGIILPEELNLAESTVAYKSAVERAAVIRELRPGWDSYKAEKPDIRLLEYSLSFLREAVVVLIDQYIDPPVPFLVPTPSGSVQFEWQIGDRELELEVVSQDSFHYLMESPGYESEGSASRWEGIRLIIWSATGEAV